MKKRILLYAICFLFLMGCEKNNNPDSLENETSDQNTPMASETEPQPETLPQLEVDCSGTYYKTEIEPAAYDEGKVLEYLIPGFDRNRVQQEDGTEGTDYFIEMDGVKHSWCLGEGNFYSFSYYNDRENVLKLSEEEALAISDAFVEQTGLPVAGDPIIEFLEQGAGVGYTVCYSLLYEGVPVLGREAYNLKNGDDEDGFAYGEYIEVSVGGNGISNVQLSHLYDMGTVLAEYQGSEDFIRMEKLGKITGMAGSAWQNVSEDGGPAVGNASLIYIPAEEDGKLVLLPAFRVERELTLDGQARRMQPMLIDAVTGYVYKY